MLIIFAIISDARDATLIKSSFVDCRLSVSIVRPLALKIKSCCRHGKTKSTFHKVTQVDIISIVFKVSLLFIACQER